MAEQPEQKLVARESIERPRAAEPAPPPAPAAIDDKWLDSFYRECGREVTLAYTTLNQMKNWAMLVTAAAISGLAFGTTATNYPTVEMLVGVVVVYTFSLRFFIRAILSYINLVRWNKLQSDCVQLRLLPRIASDGTVNPSAKLLSDVKEDIQNYYYEWLSPISRKRQLLHNLKLGFALIFALPLFFMVSGVFVLWSSPVVKGLAMFVLGDTIVEFNDFLKSRYFDDVNAFGKRKSRGKIYENFPVPATDSWFLASWIIVLLVSIIVATWPTVWAWLIKLF